MKTKSAPRSIPVDPELEGDPQELETASEEAAPNAGAPELTAETETLTEWDTPQRAAGEAIPKVVPEDEALAGESLVEEGVEEADRDQRIAAADPDFEP